MPFGEEERTEVIRALLLMMAAKDRATYTHLHHVSLYSTRLARTLALPAVEVDRIRLGALLHDIGKVAIPDAILQKPSRLTDEERRQMREHPHLGAALIGRFACLDASAPLVRGHHEWFNGCGYPDGLAGKQIPLGARIIAVADAFDTMTTPRPYRETISEAEAIAELRRCSGTQFDPALVELFVHLLEQEPASRRRI